MFIMFYRFALHFIILFMSFMFLCETLLLLKVDRLKDTQPYRNNQTHPSFNYMRNILPLLETCTAHNPPEIPLQYLGHTLIIEYEWHRNRNWFDRTEIRYGGFSVATSSSKFTVQLISTSHLSSKIPVTVVHLTSITSKLMAAVL